MKKLILLLLIPVFGYSQKKGDNQIVISSQNYNKIKLVLFQNGYTLQNNDTVYLTTTSKELKKVSIALKFMILRSDSNTIIRGMIKPTISLQFYGTKTESDFEPLVYKGAKGSPIRKAWEEMERIAQLLSNQIMYTKD